jgi:hypothetical protein
VTPLSSIRTVGVLTAEPPKVVHDSPPRTSPHPSGRRKSLY